MTRRNRCVSVGIGAAIYTASLLLPAAEVKAFSSPHQVLGWDALWHGALATHSMLLGGSDLDSKIAFYWLANPALVLAWISLIAGWYRVATLSATLGMLITWILFWRASDTVMWQMGYWCWSLSMLWMALISVQPALQTQAPLPPGGEVSQTARRLPT